MQYPKHNSIILDNLAAKKAWGERMTMLRSIHKEIAPQLETLRRARRDWDEPAADYLITSRIAEEYDLGNIPGMPTPRLNSHWTAQDEHTADVYSSLADAA